MQVKTIRSERIVQGKKLSIKKAEMLGSSDLLFRAETVPDLFREEFTDSRSTDEICVYLGRDTRVLIDES